MKFDFAKVPGIDAELAARLNEDAAAQSAIADQAAPAVEEAVANRVEVKASEFKGKMDALNAKLKAAEERAAAAPNIDADELTALRQAAAKSPELQATLDAMKTKTEEAEQALKAQTETLQQMQLDHTTAKAIDEYNAAHPSVAVQPDARDVVAMLARSALRYDEGAKTYRVHDADGNVIATDKGAATPGDFISMLRKDKPSLFMQPAGSGAPGSGGGSGGDAKTISRSDFGKLPPAKQSEVARSHTITEG